MANLEGKLHEIFELEEVSERFKKREFVLEVVENPLYPQYILIQAVQDRVSLLDKFKKGDTVSVDFNIKGRPWTSPQGETRYFNSLEAWRITPSEQQTETEPVPAVEALDKSTTLEDDDDLPF